MLMVDVPLQPGRYKTLGAPFGDLRCCTGTGSEESSRFRNSIYFHDGRIIRCSSGATDAASLRMLPLSAIMDERYSVYLRNITSQK